MDIERRPSGPNLKDLKKQKTKERLLHAAKRLVSEYGYHNVSVTDIAREAGVSHGMITAYFHSKAGLLFALISLNNGTQIDALLELDLSTGSIIERIGRVVSVYLDGDLKDPEILALMQSYYWVWPVETETANQQQLALAFKPLSEILIGGVASGELRADLNVERIVRMMFSVYTQGLRLHLYESFKVEDCFDEIMAQIAVILHGCKAKN